MKPRRVLLLALVCLFVSVVFVEAAQQQQKTEDDVEGSANIENPDDEDFADVSF